MRKRLAKNGLKRTIGGDYWYERPYHIGKKASEALGAKIIEYEDEKYRTFLTMALQFFIRR